MPGAEILCGDVFSADLLEIGIYIRGRHGACLILLIKILEQFLPWQLLTGADDLGDAPIVYAKLPNFATFSLEVEAQLAAIDLHVPVLEGGEAVALILLGVFITSYPNERCLQEVGDGRENLLSGEPR